MRTTFPLRGPSGEPIDLRRTIVSHGVASLPPFEPANDDSELTGTLACGRTVRTVRVSTAGPRSGAIEILGRPVSDATAERFFASMRWVLRLDEDLGELYELLAEDPELSWAARGAGRMMRCPTVFEDVVKTICTTNCAWSATVRMVSALVEHLGRPAPGAEPGTWRGRAFPEPAALAEADDVFYKEVVRAGYRGPYLRSLARSVVDGEVDLEAWAASTPDEIPDEELSKMLQSLPGVGPYAAAHIMMMIGRYSPLILDSWTRPTYARIAGRKKVTDAAIERRFRRYGRYAGLVFWLYLTRSWAPEPMHPASG